MWKAVKDWEGFYEVNENGDVKSLRTNKLVTHDLNNFGYHRVTFYDKPRHKRMFVHRLVAETFLENPNNFKEVNHINENKNDNSVNNLEWCDRVHNERENHKSGGKQYTPFKVIYTNGEIEYFDFVVDLAKKIGVSKTLVRFFLNGTSKTYPKYGISSINYI